MGDQGLFPNWLVWTPNCTVKCLSQITLLKYIISLISLLGGLYTPQGFLPWLKIQIMITFAKENPGQKTGLQTAGGPGLLLPVYFSFNRGFPSVQLVWHTLLDFQKTDDEQ